MNVLAAVGWALQEALPIAIQRPKRERDPWAHNPREGTLGTTETRRSDTSGTATVDQKPEMVTIPASDVDRATEFYRRIGWRQDLTPPGSCVVHFTPPGLWVLGPTRHNPHSVRGPGRSEEA
jgi:hypothetical protein